MLTTTPHLHTRQPSPTTVEYTVSNRPPPTLRLRLLLLSTLFLRIFVIFGTLLVLHARWRQYVQQQQQPMQQLSSSLTASFDTRVTTSPSSSSTSSAPPSSSPPPLPPFSSPTAPTFLSFAFLEHLLSATHASPAGRLAAHLAASLPLAALLACSAALLGGALLLRAHTRESLLVLRGLGIQTTTASSGGGGGGGSFGTMAKTRFIPTDKIQDVLVNEAFRGFEVRYYLAVAVRGEDELVVVFPRLLPRRKIVEAVWRGVRDCLYEPEPVREGGGGGGAPPEEKAGRGGENKTEEK